MYPAIMANEINLNFSKNRSVMALSQKKYWEQVIAANINFEMGV